MLKEKIVEKGSRQVVTGDGGGSGTYRIVAMQKSDGKYSAKVYVPEDAKIASFGPIVGKRKKLVMRLARCAAGCMIGGQRAGESSHDKNMTSQLLHEAGADIMHSEIKKNPDDKEKGFFREFLSGGPKPKIDGATPEDIGSMRDIVTNRQLDPDDAFRFGYFYGIIKGINACGASPQKILNRKRIKEAYLKRIQDANFADAESRLGN